MRTRQCGAALITAMLVVTLVATLAAAMVWKQFRAVQIEAAERARTQAGWVLNGALDWARLILREDSIELDHLGEVWAVPLAESRLSTFLAADRANAQEQDGPEAFLSGRIEDAQSRYNLANLGGAEIDPLEKRTFVRLCTSAGLPTDLSERLAVQLNEALKATSDTQKAPVRPQTIGQLRWLGLPADAVARLEPWVVMLDKPSPVNLNTAPREVIAALFDGMNLGGAEHLVQLRKNSPYKGLDAVKAVLPEAVRQAQGFNEKFEKRASIRTEHFFVIGRLRLDERVVEQRSLVERRDRNAVKVLWRDRVQQDLGESTRSDGVRAP